MIGNKYKQGVPQTVSAHSTENAFAQIHKANRAISVAVVVALAVMTVLLAFGILRLNQLYQTQQEQLQITQQDIEARAQSNTLILEGLKNTNRDTQYLICSIVTVQIGDRVAPDEIKKICGPVLDNPGQTQDASDDSQSNFSPTNSVNNKQTSQPNPQNTGSVKTSQKQEAAPATTKPQSQTQKPNTNTATQPEPGLVEAIGGELNVTTCPVQKLLGQDCIIKQGG